jgi:hypothetical protein
MAKAQTNEPRVKVVDPPEKWIETLGSCVTALEGAQPETRRAVFGFLRSKYRDDWPSDAY